MIRACHNCWFWHLSNLTHSYQVTNEFVHIYTLQILIGSSFDVNNKRQTLCRVCFWPLCLLCLALLFRTSFWFNTVLLLHDAALCHLLFLSTSASHFIYSVFLFLCFHFSLFVFLFLCLRCVWHSRPSAWPVRTAWWRIWRLWRLWDPHPPSALIKPAPWRRTAWLSLTCGSTIRSMRRTPPKISRVSC